MTRTQILEKGDRVKVVGKFARFFDGEIGTVLRLEHQDRENGHMNIYRISFRGEENCIMSRFLRRLGERRDLAKASE
jgi:hypothetical protein